MNIISVEFAIISIAAAIIYYLINQSFRVGFLVILSCAFIASFNYLLLPYVLIYSLINYYIGLKLPDSKNKVLLYRTGIIFNVLQLVLLRYSSFAIDPFFHLINSDFQLSKLSEIIVPIGISYFSLQGLGYIISVNMGWEKPEKKFLDFLLYISFFPKFLSGPVERSNHFLPQLKESQTFEESRVSLGLKIALIGFLKKIAIANQMAPFVLNSFSDLGSVDGSSLIILLLLLPMYLYFDFSGYTDIAIGFAKMFGLDLLPNFNRPFFAENVTTFWKRFHISLAAWFGNYIYRQIIFRRRKWGVYGSTMFAVFITWMLFGIWHGAGWNFMLLGLLQALAINYEYFTRKFRYRLFSRWPRFLKVWFGRIFTYLFYGASLVFFFSPDIHSTVTFFSGLSAIDSSIILIILRNIPLSAIVLALLFFALELLEEDYNKFFIKVKYFWSDGWKFSRLFRWSIYSFILAMLFVLGNQAQQFIYAQF